MDDFDDLEVEVLDDELVPTPVKGEDAPASPPAPAPASARPASSVGSASLPPLTKRPLGALAPLPPLGTKPKAPSSRGFATATPPAFVAPAARSAAGTKSSGEMEVTGSMMKGDVSSDDDTSSEEEIEVFDVPPRNPPRPPPANEPVLDPFADDDVASTVADLSSGDAAIDAIDAISAAAAEASRAGVHRLTEKYVDKFDLDIDGEEETAFVAGSSATVDDDGDAREDEFGYAFEGKDREGKTHAREFKAEPMPSALVTDVRRMPMETFAEEDEEEEEEEDEEEEEEEEEEEDGERSAAARAKAEAEADALRALEAEAQADRSRALEETAKTARPEDAAARAVAAAAKARVAREAAGVALPAKARPTDPAPSRRLRERTDGDSDPNAESPKRTTKVADEWDAVNAAREVEDAAAAATGEAVDGSKVAVAGPISYADARRRFEAADISALVGDLVVEDPPIGGPCACLFAPPRLGDALEADRERVFAVAKMKMKDDDETHARVLNAVYARLVGGDRPPPRFGSHWEDVGFQGADPATDLRGCGMLGLLQLLMLVDRNPGNAKAIHALSRDPVQEFPMAPLSINITHIALKAMRKGLLVAESKRRGSVWDAADAFYAGAFYEFYHRWKTGGKTIKDSGHVRKELEEFLLTKAGARRALALAEEAKLGRERAGGVGKKAKGGDIVFASI